VVGGGREGQGEPDGESGRGTRSAAAGPAAEATIRSCCARKGSRELRARVIPFKLSSGLFVGPGVPAKSERLGRYIYTTLFFFLIDGGLYSVTALRER